MVTGDAQAGGGKGSVGEKREEGLSSTKEQGDTPGMATNPTGNGSETLDGEGRGGKQTGMLDLTPLE